ncbi:MAG TPA: TetR/AcrR family transcriptional regulator, partial [Stellaceae bacterium]|nr:TetR/AcrR family transcriptional regulator [Stellaceae bacterium]
IFVGARKRRNGAASAARRDAPNGKSSRRLAAADREQQILAEAVRFFAEVGFNGHTRELAQRLHITQPLLYRYFPTKQDLIERVFKEIFFTRIDPQWSQLIADRTRPLEDRLIEFYQHYARATYSYEWIRIYMFSALMGNDINRRYIKIVEEKILKPICKEIRHHCGLGSGDAVTEAELEHVWVMHGGIFYYAVRKYVYHSRVGDDLTAIVRRAVRGVLAGATASFTASALKGAKE